MGVCGRAESKVQKATDGFVVPAIEKNNSLECCCLPSSIVVINNIVSTKHYN
jgi:hypothetical protein